MKHVNIFYKENSKIFYGKPIFKETERGSVAACGLVPRPSIQHQAWVYLGFYKRAADFMNDSFIKCVSSILKY